MDTISETAFSEFQIIHRNKLHVFKSYHSLETFQVKKAHPLLRPFMRQRNKKIRKIEYKLETKNNLPEGYLAGLLYKTSEGQNYKRQAYNIAQDYFYAKLRWEIQNTIERLLPPAVEPHRRQPISYKDLTPEPLYQVMEARYSTGPPSRRSKETTPLPILKGNPSFRCSCKYRASAPSVNLLAELQPINLSDDIKI